MKMRKLLSTEFIQSQLKAQKTVVKGVNAELSESSIRTYVYYLQVYM